MALIADILLVAGSFGVAVYCFILSRRLNKFNNLENGMGGAVAVLSSQIDDLEKTISHAQDSASASAQQLDQLNKEAEMISSRIQLQMAALHDLEVLEAQQRVEEHSVGIEEDCELVFRRTRVAQ